MPPSNVLEMEARAYRAGNTESRRIEHPSTHAEWVARYGFLEDSYLGTAYSVGDIKTMKLFRALDPEGEIIAETRRLTRDVQHVVDTDAQALAGQAWSLDLQDGAPDTVLAIAEAVWKRSRVQQKKGAWARTGANLGSVMVEAVRMSGTRPYRTTFAAYDPRHVTLDYDIETGTTIEKATISIPYFEQAEMGPNGELVENPIGHTYVRVLTRERVDVYLDGKLQEAESGPHMLGEVPLVHLPFVELLADPCHGLWAAQGLEHALSLVDSLLTQVLAIGNRHANPILALSGAKIGGSSDVFLFGRVIDGLPQGARAEYLEATLAGVSAILEAAQQARSQARETLPEFLFTEAGANSSGSALNFRATAFVNKMQEVRGRWYDALARLTEYAVCMEQGIAYDHETDWFTVSAGPVLPVNVSEELGSLHEVLDRGGLKRIDYVKRLQALGFVPAEADPEQYAQEVADERAEAAVLESGNLAAIFGGGVQTTAEPIDGETVGGVQTVDLPTP